MKKIILSLVGIVILGYILYSRVDYVQFIELLRTEISIYTYLSLFFVINLQHLFRAIRFRQIHNRVITGKITFLQSLIVTSGSFFLAMATPNKLGDNFRALFFKDNKKQIMAITFYEYFIDVIVSVFLPLIALYAVYVKIPIATYLLAVVIASLLVVYLFFPVFIRAIGRIPYIKKIIVFFEEIVSVHKSVKQVKGTLLYILAYTILFNVVYFAIQYAILMDMGASIDFIEVIAASGLSFLIGAFSMVPMGLGVREMTSYSLFIHFGVATQIAMASVLLMRGITLSLLISGSIGYFISVYRNR